MPADTIKLPLPNQVVAGRYRLISRLGTGGMGLVFLAEHLGVGNQVAVKFLDPEPTEDTHRIARFLREAKVSLEVKHPGAAQLLDVGRDDDGRPYLVFEYVEGKDLRDLLKEEGRIRFDEAREIALKVAEVLAFAHERHIVHRDVKPENIRIRRDLSGPHVKVLDFGIARLLRAGGIRLTVAGTLAGTPRYMAPEQVRDTEIDGRTDGYALGLVFFEMLTGAPAFAGKNISHILLKQVQEPLAPLKSVAADLDDVDASAIDAFLGTACAKDPDARFASMADFVAALGSLPVDAASWPAPRLLPPVPPAPTTELPHPRGAGLSDTVVRGHGASGPTAASSAPLAREVPTEPARPSARRPESAPPSSPSSRARDRAAAAETVRGAPVPVPMPPPRRRSAWLVIGALAVVLAAALVATAYWLGLSLGR